MVELSHRPEISVAQLAREHGINDNLLFKWRQYWREGKLRPPSTTENNVPELLPITLDAEDVVPTTSPRSQPVGHCCKVSDEAAFCLIQRPYISKTLLTRRISPRGSP
ncbi:transposase (plasmid) [Escherichia coli]|nr:transposase [Escherichia coli]WLM88385.1 transposase [Escherichia coli]